MVGFVVEDDDVLLAAQLAADAAHHLVGRLGERARLALRSRIALVSLPASPRLAQQEGVEVGDDDLGLAEPLEQVGRARCRAGGSSSRGSFGSSTRSRSRMVMPGVTIRNASEKRASCGLASLLSACQAMSIAMTTVLPEPVAILNAMRGRPGFDVVVRLAQLVLDPGVAVLPGDLGDVDGGFERLDLAEEQLRSRSGRSSSRAGCVSSA